MKRPEVARWPDPQGIDYLAHYDERIEIMVANGVSEQRANEQAYRECSGMRRLVGAGQLISAEHEQRSIR